MEDTGVAVVLRAVQYAVDHQPAMSHCLGDGDYPHKVVQASSGMDRGTTVSLAPHCASDRFFLPRVRSTEGRTEEAQHAVWPVLEHSCMSLSPHKQTKRSRTSFADNRLYVSWLVYILAAHAATTTPLRINRDERPIAATPCGDPLAVASVYL